jgi:diadenosine tetraphosphate (Ap4A) HIT family hydrolase
MLGFPRRLILRAIFVADWILHPQLERDTASLGDLPLSRVLVSNDANYPWLILVPRRADITEVIDLGEADQARLMTEVTRVARALRDLTSCLKLNIAALGNAVPQLHVHVIARFRNDPAWPRPVWGVVPPCAYQREDLDKFTGSLRAKIGLA